MLTRALLRKYQDSSGTPFLRDILGFIAAVLVARFYFRASIRRRKIGEVMKWAMVEKTIS